ncbi:MAG: hypothetical protein R3D56_04945 [Paracoccaceae bacterium]|jgi:chromosome segregation ATPase
MSDIAEFERRILYALERIGAGMDRLGEGGGTSAAVEAIDVDVLKAELEAERATNAQLTERVRAIKERQETLVSGLERKVARLGEQLGQLEAELGRQRQLNGDLAALTRKLSDAARDGGADPGLINEALAAEVEALRAERAGEMAEMAEILAELKPLIGEMA